MSDTKTLEPLTTVARPVGEARPPRRKKRHERPRPWCRAVVPDLASAEELLDQLEAAGHDERKLTITGDSIIVRWRPKPAGRSRTGRPTAMQVAVVIGLLVLCAVVALAVG